MSSRQCKPLIFENVKKSLITINKNYLYVYNVWTWHILLQDTENSDVRFSQVTISIFRKGYICMKSGTPSVLSMNISFQTETITSTSSMPMWPRACAYGFKNINQGRSISLTWTMNCRPSCITERRYVIVLRQISD